MDKKVIQISALNHLLKDRYSIKKLAYKLVPEDYSPDEIDKTERYFIVNNKISVAMVEDFCCTFFSDTTIIFEDGSSLQLWAGNINVDEKHERVRDNSYVSPHLTRVSNDLVELNERVFSWLENLCKRESDLDFNEIVNHIQIYHIDDVYVWSKCSFKEEYAPGKFCTTSNYNSCLSETEIKEILSLVKDESLKFRLSGVLSSYDRRANLEDFKTSYSYEHFKKDFEPITIHHCMLE